MNFTQAIRSYFKNYATFSGRASRSEFWYAALFTSLVSAAIDIVSPSGGHWVMGEWQSYGSSALSNLWSLATLVPSLAITWRRLHDVEKSGGFFFWILLPIVGWIILLVQLVKRGTSGTNRFDLAQ
jgi:uncharacterized membrane protein YhaH (DUF805 family)